MAPSSTTETLKCPPNDSAPVTLRIDEHGTPMVLHPHAGNLLRFAPVRSIMWDRTGGNTVTLEISLAKVADLRPSKQPPTGDPGKDDSGRSDKRAPERSDKSASSRKTKGSK